MINVVRIWILLSTLLVSAGWILSALHQLNHVGYAAIFALAAVAFVSRWKRNKIFTMENFRRAFHKFPRRFKRLPPFLFLLLALLTFTGGCLYPDVNWDANCYRLPRVFHWLWENQWHWIYTSDPKMNVAACGYEWITAPLVLLTGNDRLLFLITWLPFLMLPGLIFSLFRRLQVRPRTAWWWMWFLASGWCFVFQAGSGANDSFAAVYALAAVDFALRAKEKKCANDLWLSILSSALLTDTKQTDLPLVALWLIAAWPGFRLFFSKPIATVVVVTFAILVSIVPVSAFTFAHYRTWLPPQNNEMAAFGNFQLNPFWGIIGNSFCLPAQNLWPPFSEFLPPFYGDNIWEWNLRMSDFLHTGFGAHFASFEKFGHLSMTHDKSPGEENAGIGLGIILLTLAAFYEKWRLRKSPVKVMPSNVFLRSLRWTPWLLLLIFMAKVGTYENARQLAPYYIFLFPSLLAGAGHEIVSRQRQWQKFGIAVMMLTILMLITLPARPLFPAQTILKNLHAYFPDNKIIRNECDRYFESYQRKIELRRARLKTLLPPHEKVIGYCPGVGACDEPAIWLPYPGQSARWILSEDFVEQLRQAKIHYLVANDSFLANRHLSLAEWMKQYDATLVGECDDESHPISYALFPRTIKLTKLYVVQIDQSKP
jgi:hypothetical protein